MSINVNRSVLDPFYRYKMPRLIAKVEGKGNGIKTVIANMTEIAKALERPPSYPTKYFGFELGAQTNVDLKNERYIVNGEHDAAKLQDILDGFIKKFVLCPACDNPETQLSVRKNVIHSKCKACGHAFTLDPKLKLATFVIKNPPKLDLDYEKLSKAKTVDKTAEADAAANGGNNSDENDHSSEGMDDDDDWAPEPVNDEHLAANIGRLVISKDLEKSVEDRLDMLHQFFVEKKKAEDAINSKDLLHEAERLDLKQKAPLLLVDAFLDNKVIVDDQFNKYKNVFLRFTMGDKKAQRYLLGGLEQLIVKHEADLLPKAANLIKKLYDLDICEEEAILAWADKPSSKYVSKSQAKAIIAKAEAVINWLKEAESESEEEDSEDDVVDFEDKKVSALKEEMKEREMKKTEAKVVCEDGEEVDIDDI